MDSEVQPLASRQAAEGSAETHTLVGAHSPARPLVALANQAPLGVQVAAVLPNQPTGARVVPVVRVVPQERQVEVVATRASGPAVVEVRTK